MRLRIIILKRRRRILINWITSKNESGCQIEGGRERLCVYVCVSERERERERIFNATA